MMVKDFKRGAIVTDNETGRMLHKGGVCTPSDT